MSNRSIRGIVTALLLTLGFGAAAQAKPLTAGAASLRQGSVLEELTAFGAALFLTLKDGGDLCGHGYCPTPPTPPPPIHTISVIVTPRDPVPIGRQ